MGDDGQLRALWHEIVEWFDLHAPRSARLIDRSGASDAEVAAAEAASGLEWTDELRSWFSLHAGTDPLDGFRLFGLQEPLSLSTSRQVRADALDVWAEIADGQDGDWLADEIGRPAGSHVLSFRPEFIPIAHDPGGSMLLVDLRHGPRRGMVVERWDESGIAGDERSWPSLTALLEELFNALRSTASIAGWSASVSRGWVSWQLDPPELQPDHHDAMRGDMTPDDGGWIDIPPDGWTEPWPPRLPDDLWLPLGVDTDQVTNGMVVWLGLADDSTSDPRAATRLSISYRRDQDARAAASPERDAARPAPTQRRRSRLRAQPTPPLMEVWDQLVAWLELHAPETARQVAASRTDAARVAAAESAAGTGVPWTAELRWWFTVTPHLVQDGEGGHLLGPYMTLTAEEAVSDMTMWRDIMAEIPEALDPARGGQAGDDATGFRPEWVPIAREGTGVTLAVDLRPGERHGCVVTYAAEDGARSDSSDDTWSGLGALLLDVLCALADGDHFAWARAQVSARGVVRWPFDDDAFPPPPHLSWTWSMTRDRVAAAWEAGDDDGVWAAIVDALLTARTLTDQQAGEATWETPLPIGDPVIDALLTGAARHVDATLGVNGDAWHWDRELAQTIPVEAGLDTAEVERLQAVTPVGFRSVGLLLDPSRLPY